MSTTALARRSGMFTENPSTRIIPFRSSFPTVRPSHARSALATEGDLVEGIVRGEPAACEALVRLHGPRMTAAARRLLASEDDVADVIQDAFLAAFRSIGDFQRSSTLATWLHRIVVNAALMRLRRRRRTAEVTVDATPSAWDALPTRPAPWRTSAVAAADELVREETRAAVRRAIEALPERYRTVVELRDIEGLTTDEAATALGVRRGAVKTRLHRARILLRRRLATTLS